MLDTRTRGVVLRSIPVVLVFLLSMTAFEAGVSVSDRPSIASAGHLGRIYYAVGLFVLGGLDLGHPVGGPFWARMMLWSAYFIGPGVTTTAVAEGFIWVVRPQWWQRYRLRDHVVVVGAGRIGALCLHSARSAFPERPLVVVDRASALATVAEAERRYKAQFLQGDIKLLGTERALHLEKCRGLVLATDNDLTNLESAWDLHARHPQLRLAVHVSDIALARTAGELGAEGMVTVFNSHRIAAAHLYKRFLHTHFESTSYRDVVVVAGFGRFGQTILEYLQSHAAEDLQRVLVVDRSATQRTALFAEQIGFHPACQLDTVDADVADHTAWLRVQQALGDTVAVPVFVLCVDADKANLQAAVSLRRLFPESPIFVRVFSGSRFVDDMARHHRFEALAVEELLRTALTESFERVFPE